VAAAAGAVDATSAAATVAAFAVFDPTNSGTISSHTLRAVFSGALGAAPLSAASVDGLVGAGDPAGTGAVDYAALVAKVFADHDRLAAARRAAEQAAAAGGGGKGAKKVAPAKK
jgi:hypothetical protein